LPKAIIRQISDICASLGLIRHGQRAGADEPQRCVVPNLLRARAQAGARTYRRPIGTTLALSPAMDLVRRIDRRNGLLLAGVVALVTLPGCAVVKGIFKAGMWTGVIAVVIVLALIGWAVSALAKH
jgi:hypothetical protein